MTMSPEEEVMMEVMRLIKALDERKDPTYEEGLRRTVPSSQKAHAVRVPEIKKLASEWRKTHRNVEFDYLFPLAEMLWATGWREERLLALELVRRSEDALDAVDFEWFRRLSGEVDNWEVIDHMAEATAHMLQRQPRLLQRVESLTYSDSPWQRRLALVTMIVAGRDFAWRPALERFTERMSKDPHPAVKKAVTWARRELKKPEGSLT
jgi:3-methyladenine DNA glycosylase AlkD